MDKLDQKLLQILDWRARTPLNQIAKKLRSNKDVIGYRLRRLEEREVILGYYPVLDMSKLGFYTTRVYFDLDEISPEKEIKFVKFLDKTIKAGLIFRMDYPYRYGIFLWVRSVYDVQEVLIKIKRFLKKSLVKYDHSVICVFRQFPKDYLFGKPHHEEFRSLEPAKEVTYDREDMVILQELAKNARQTSSSISRATKIPQSTVSSKIRRLEKKEIIQGYRAQINISRLGYTNYFLELYLSDNSNLKEIEAWANIHKNVVWLQKIIGSCDIEIEVEVRGRLELEEFLKSLRRRFPNIRKIIFFSQEYKKLTYLPTQLS